MCATGMITLSVGRRGVMQSAILKVWNGFWLWYIAYLVLTPLVTLDLMREIGSLGQPGRRSTAWLLLYAVLVPGCWYQVIRLSREYWHWRKRR